MSKELSFSDFAFEDASSDLTQYFAVTSDHKPTPPTVDTERNSSNSLPDSKPPKSRRYKLYIIVIVLLLIGLFTAFALYRHQNSAATQLRQSQTELQKKIEQADSLHASEIQALAEKIATMRSEIDSDIPADINNQFNALLTQLKNLSNSSDQNIATTAQSLMAALTNQSGQGIALSGPNNTTISNTGVLSINNQTGNLSLQGTPDQVNVS